MTASTRLALSVALATALSAAGAPPARAEAGVIRDENGCRFANPSPKPNEQVTWSGGCRDGWGDGQGTLRWLVNGVPTYIYVGAVAAGKLEGDGTENIGGDRYAGHFADGHRQGHGVFTWRDGLRYEGDFVRGQMAGRGELRLPDGTRFEGRFDKNVLQAPVTLVKPQADGELRLPMEMPGDASAPPPSRPASGAANAARIDAMADCRPRNFPPQALFQGATGASGFSLRIEPDARVSRVWIDRPSGTDFAHQILDLTALAALLNCPREGGAQAEWLQFTYVWKLE